MPKFTLLTCVLILIATGCTSTGDGIGATTPTRSIAAAGPASDDNFRLQIAQLQPGTPKPTVLQQLGKPDEKRPGVAGQPAADPQPPATIFAGSRYVDWIYRRGGMEYHVFLAGSATDPGRWEVASIASVKPVAP